jgi:DNA polymerase-3 subunit epsilon
VLDIEFQPELPNWAKRLAVFDLETTGLDLTNARVVTACIAVLDANGQELDVEEWLVDPGIEIPEVATKVHGISTAKAQAEGIAASEAILQIVEKLRSLNSQMPLVAFNAPFDFTILQNEAIRYGFDPLVPDPVVDPLVIDRELRFGPGKRNLLILCSLYGVQLSAAHNSTADAVAAGRLAQAQAGRYPKLNLDSSELHKLQVGWSDKWTRNLHDWLEKEDRPVDRAEIGWPVRAS